MADSECPLCRKLDARAQFPEGELVWEFPHSVAFLGDHQFYDGYCVLVARRHASELSELGGPERLAFFEEMCLLARGIGEQFRPHKLNYELLGNQVPHLHWHIVPRYRDDPDRLDPIWLPLERAKNDPALRQRLQTGPRPRQETAAALRTKLKLWLGIPA
jgi:diadenosine tetraphosphate (Ap4A) HIT family hydrolase